MLLLLLVLGCIVCVTVSGNDGVGVCEVSFIAYHPSPLEAKWTKHVEEWQDKVCDHTPNSDMNLWLDNVAEFFVPSTPKFFESPGETPPDALTMNSALSFFTHKHVCPDSHVKYVHTPIEPTASIVRDPRKCWEQLTEKYTQSKAYLVPLSGDGRKQLNGGNKKSRAFLFDAGATVAVVKAKGNNTDSRVDSSNWSGTNWIYDWYKSVGIVFDEVHAWEPDKANRGKAHNGGRAGRGKGKGRGKRGGKRKGGGNERNNYRVLQQGDGKNDDRNRNVDINANGNNHKTEGEALEESFYPDGVLHFYNVGVTDEVGAVHNPLHLISEICTPDDFVVFKLDIDSKFEINIVNQLLKDPKLMNLVDDFYYEHHVRNDVMRMHSLGKNSNSRYTLAAWYDMVNSGRNRGLRMHFWP